MKRWLAAYAVAFFAFLHLPLLTLAFFSFNSSRFTQWEHFSLDWYRAIFRDPQLIDATWNSVIVALISTVISTVARHLCAYGLWKYSIAVADRNALSFAGHTGNRHRNLFAGAFSMDVPLAALASRALHRGACACRVFHRLRGDRDFGATANAESDRWKKRPWIWAPMNGRPSFM